MCGIVGFTGKRSPALLDSLLSQIQHRGYDETFTSFLPGINMGMNRLTINDLTKNLYPMKFKHFLLHFNGEIYNFPQLKSHLLKKGIKLKSKCDAEVILPLYTLHGPNSFTKLEGMFALSIYDTQKKQLILARDKAGEKPLYFTKTKNFMFSSE
ncbi:asparagine synthetase B, partial [Pseudomonadota bacterium]